jgi:threonine/homoserine/homoserine lactone efflux protein
MLSPGPANLVSLAFSSRCGSRQIVLFQCGILLVYAVVAFGMAVTAIQLGDFFMNSAVFLQIAGGAFIIYLGIGLILTPQKPGESGSAPTFRSGALLQIFNPKFPPVVLAILSTRSDTNFLATAGIIVTVGAIGLALYSSVGSLIHRFVSADRHLRLLNIVFGLLLCAVGVWITVGAVSARWFVFSSG